MLGLLANVDILVVGGGPAGLLAASHLSEALKVAVIERGSLGETDKCWVTTKRRLQKHGLGDCALSEPTVMSAGTFLGSYISVKGDYVVVDDERLLGTLLARCVENGVELLEDCRLLNLRWERDEIIAETTKGQISAKLVIDASGGGSLVAATFRLHKIHGFYSIYGSHLKRIHLKTGEIILGYVHQLGNPPPVIEVFPTGADSAYCVLFVYSKLLINPDALRQAFEDHCKHNPFFDLRADTEFHGRKAGAIPIGRRRKNFLPGVVPFGEAGLFQPPLMGTAFNEALEHAHDVLGRILTDFPRKHSIVRFPLRKKLQDRVQFLIIKAILHGDVRRLDHAFRVMNTLSEKVLFKFFSNELGWAELIQVAAKLPSCVLGTFDLDSKSIQEAASRRKFQH